MPKNVGTIDRAIRTLIAIIFLSLFQTGLAEGALGATLAIIGIILLFTSVISYCPIYSIFKINTHDSNQ